MKKGLIAVLIVLFLIIVGVTTYFIADKVINKPDESSNSVNTTNSSSNAGTTANAVENTTSNTNNTVANTTKNNSNEKSDDVKKIEISDDEVLNILLKAKTFDKVSELSNQDKLEIVYHALNEKKINAYATRKNSTDNGTVEFTKDEINEIVYSLFGVKLDKYESWGESLVYKDGKFILHYSDAGTETYTAKNVERDAAAGTAYTEYDLYYSDMGSTPVKKGRYVIARSSVTSFVSSKRAAE